MFTNLHELAKKATLMITVAAEGDDQLRVNITAAPFDTKAKASLPQPLSLVATPAEFDADFTTALGTWQAPKRTLLQQAQDAAGQPAAAGEAPKALPAPEKAKPGRKARGTKPADNTDAGDAGSAGDAGGDQVDPPASGDDSTVPAPDEPVAGSAQPAAPVDEVAPAAAPATYEKAPAASGGAVVDTFTIDLF